MKTLSTASMIITFAFYLLLPTELVADLNLVARWGIGPSKVMTLIGDTLVYSNGSYLKTADISNPEDVYNYPHCFSQMW